MPAMKRHPTDYPGVVYVEAKRIGGTGTERVYYVRFKKGGRLVEEKAGRQYADNMTPAKANRIRGERIEGKRPSRKEAREEREAAKKADADRWTIAKLWTEYKERHPNLKGLTTDENRFENHLEDDFGPREPKDLLPLDVERLKKKLRAAKGRADEALSPATVRNVLELLRRIVNFGVRSHLCDPMPFKIGSKKAGAAVQMPEVNNEKTEDLTAEQLQALVKAMDEAEDLQAANLMRLALYTGMRRGELFKLTWDDVDFDRGFIKIRDPKGKKDQTIPLNDAARELLEGHPKTPAKKPSPYVFPGRKGQKRSDINKAVRAITDAAGLPADFRPLHGLRHAYASMLASSGQVDLYTIQKLLTHKSPQMTQRYAHLRDDALKRASAVAGEIIAQASQTETEEVESG